MRLKEILSGINYSAHGNFGDMEISDISFDSRKVDQKSLFIAIKGTVSDGHKYINDVINRGCRAIIIDNPAFDPDSLASDNKNIVFIRCKDSRYALALTAANLYDNPSRKINLIGVTGTNGKTSIATLLYHLFTKLGYNCGLISTIANYVGDKEYPTDHTTPDPITLNSLFAEMVLTGCEYAFMEVSSHAIDQERISGLKFRGAIFTNLTRDHLDYHGDFKNYLNCKKRLFDSLEKEAFALINIDDKNSEVMVQNCKASIYRYSNRSLADFTVRILESTIEGSLVKINGKEIWTRFIGEHNALNLLAVYSVASIMGTDEDELLKHLSTLKAVSGRLEYEKGGDNITAVVDYAHTPDALENVLKTLKKISGRNTLWVVFGCGGDRDKGKRPQMGKIAGIYADKIIVTSDNPRSENPDTIINDIKEGMDQQVRKRSLFIADRKEAIRTAIMTAGKDSIILVAGKGHETYQIIDGVKHHFDDKEIIRECFNEII